MHSKYEKKDEWWRRGKDFLVQVKRSDVTPYGLDDGGQRWCVYVFIYPKHPHFTEFDGTESMLQPAACALPGHSYPSFCRIHADNKSGSITSYQVGWDYNHLYDQRFTEIATAEDAVEVFKDAELVFEWLAARQQAGEQEQPCDTDSN